METINVDFAALSPTRKADRAKAADVLRAIAERFGFTTSAQATAREVTVNLEHPCGAAASIQIDKFSKDIELVAWHTETGSGWTYPDSFGDVNPHHHQKATKAYQWARLPACLQHDCRKIAAITDGES